MELSIIIVNYKSKGKLANCLRSLALSDLDGITHEILVVENASGDDLSDLLNSSPEAKLLASPANLGMGGGNNLGITQTSGEYILIANPDIVFRSNSIRNLLDFMRHSPEAAIVGPKLLNPDGTLQYSCARFPSFFVPILRRTRIGRYLPRAVNRYLMKDVSHDHTGAVDWIMGACLLVRRGELFQDGKLFDERFFMYFEDVDLCRRAREKGMYTVYLPGAAVTHDHQRESARLPWYHAIFNDKLAREHIRSWWQYFIKWGLKPAPKIKTYAKD